MPRYMITRTLPPLTPEEIETIRLRSAAVCKEMGINWIRSHFTSDGKLSFCEYEAVDEKAVREHARRAGIPVDTITMLGLELGPSLRAQMC
jgi:hypothetical protein